MRIRSGGYQLLVRGVAVLASFGVVGSSAVVVAAPVAGGEDRGADSGLDGLRCGRLR